jgi:hypothetical protein
MPINKFGGYDYDANNVIITDSPESRSAKLRAGDRLGEPGGYTGGGIQSAGRITMGGVIHEPSTGTPNIRQLWRQFEAAHQPGTPQPLRLAYFGEVFAWAEPESITEVHGSPPFIGARQFEVSFSLVDPFWYENQEQGPQSLTVGGTTSINNGGSRSASPVINLTVTHPGTVTLTSPNGDQFQIFANLTGTYSIDSYQRFVTRNTANYHYRWDGVFPSLAPGQTNLGLSVTYGSVSSAVARWFNRD